MMFYDSLLILAGSSQAVSVNPSTVIEAKTEDNSIKTLNKKLYSKVKSQEISKMIIPNYPKLKSK